MRANLKRSPECRALEDRQLLNAAWAGHAMWNGAAGTGKPPAMIHPLEKGAKGQHNVAKGSAGDRFGQHAAPSAQTQTDMQTLQTDMQTLQSEIPASITAAVTADQTTIKTALASLTPAQRQSLLPSPMSWTSSTTATATATPDPSTQLNALLTAANIPSSQITTIESDFAAYQNALTTTDPTLQAKITADKAALAQDMPGAPSGALDFPAGGMDMMGGPPDRGSGHGFGPGMP
jgi:hypothetical protein